MTRKQRIELDALALRQERQWEEEAKQSVLRTKILEQQLQLYTSANKIVGGVAEGITEVIKEIKAKAGVKA